VELARERLGEPGVERIAQQRVLAADLRDAQRERRLARDRGGELFGALRLKLIVRIRVQIVFVDRRIRAHRGILNARP